MYQVAVKVIRKSLCSDLSMAIREIENQSKISECRGITTSTITISITTTSGRGVGGETIVSLKDTYESSDYYYMMMEWCDAGTLEDMLLLRYS